MKNQDLDQFGRGVQNGTARKLQLFVEVYQMVGEYPFAEMGKLIGQKWVEFTTFCTEPQDIDEEFNVVNKDHSISYNVICIK